MQIDGQRPFCQTQFQVTIFMFVLSYDNSKSMATSQSLLSLPTLPNFITAPGSYSELRKTVSDLFIWVHDSILLKAFGRYTGEYDSSIRDSTWHYYIDSIIPFFFQSSN